MNPFFQDPNEVRFPPEEVRLQELQVFPAGHSGRVKIRLMLTPFQKRPCVEVTISTIDGNQAAHISILETMLNELEFTMHLRQPQPGSEYSVEAVVYYQKLPEATSSPIDIPLPEPLIVDRQRTKFCLPEQVP
ncbi:MAG: hypothetical protein FIA98_12295 [Anaerolineae bacterium]|nr:hypothetical protein [Anaerolineae bacterium]